MTVRDHTLKPSEYNGRPCEAADELCPCRSCFHPHDFGHYTTEYLKDGRQKSVWIPRMRCLTRERGGCPTPTPPPEHVTRQGDRKNCRRCHRRADRMISRDEEMRQEQSR